MQTKYRYLIPNLITFLSLTCGISAILAAVDGRIALAGKLIIASYTLDFIDGATARALNASTEFGLQLDSLVDMVSLGVAPAILVFTHLRMQEVDMTWVYPAVILVILAGAFRLARFNLLPPKESSHSDSAGLTISAGGVILAFAVLADLSPTYPNFVPNNMYVPLMVFISFMMASTIPHPSFKQVFMDKWRTPVSLSSILILWYWYTFMNAWFVWFLGYLTITLARAGWRWRYASPPTRSQ